MCQNAEKVLRAGVNPVLFLSIFVHFIFFPFPFPLLFKKKKNKKTAYFLCKKKRKRKRRKTVWQKEKKKLRSEKKSFKKKGFKGKEKERRKKKKKEKREKEMVDVVEVKRLEPVKGSDDMEENAHEAMALLLQVAGAKNIRPDNGSKWTTQIMEVSAERVEDVLGAIGGHLSRSFQNVIANMLKGSLCVPILSEQLLM